MKTIKAYERNRDAAPAFWQVDILWLILASGADTNQMFSLMEELCPKDSGPPPHTHSQFEVFYIIDGAITFLVDDETIVGNAGSMITVPPGTVHSFRVDTETARVLNLYVPAGFERTITELGVPAAKRELPAKGLPMAHSKEEVMRLFREVGMRPVNQEDSLRTNKDQRMDVLES